LIARSFANSSPERVRVLFGKLQILSAGFMAFGHGSNDGQKFIGAFVLALMLGGVLNDVMNPQCNCEADDGNLPVLLPCMCKAVFDRTDE